VEKPTFIVFTGRTSTTARPRLISSTDDNEAFQCIDVSSRSSAADVAAELAERVLKVRFNSSSTEATRVLVVADSSSNWNSVAAIPALAQKTLVTCTRFRTQILSETAPPRTDVPFPIFYLAASFLGAELDSIARQRTLWYLLLAFTSAYPSPMADEGFWATTGASSGRWVVGVEAFECQNIQQDAEDQVERRLRRLVYPHFGEEVVAAFAAHAKSANFPPPSGRPFSSVVDAWIAGSGNHARTLADIRDSLQEFALDEHANTLSQELLRIERALADHDDAGSQKASDCTSTIGTQSILDVTPLPVLHYSARLSKTPTGLRLVEARNAAVVGERRRLIGRLKARAIESHHLWRRPNAPKTWISADFAKALSLSSLPTDTYEFLFVPSNYDSDDWHERWVLSGTTAYLSFAKIGDK